MVNLIKKYLCWVVCSLDIEEFWIKNAEDIKCMSREWTAWVEFLSLMTGYNKTVGFIRVERD